MKFKFPVLVVANIEHSIAFYEEIVGARVAMSFSDVVVFEGGFALTTRDKKSGAEVSSTILRFEDADFDGLLSDLEDCKEIEYKQQCVILDTGQRYIAFYDLDKNIIEVLEDVETVISRLLKSGMTLESISEKTGYPIEFVRRFI